MYVELKDINKTFGDYKASDHVSFGIEKGKLIGLLGPSGSGKTTILRMIAGLEQPDSGEIIIDGKVVNDIPASERGIGFVFQSYALFRYMTVYDNIAFGLKVQKADKTYIKKRVTELIELIGLKELEKRYPSQLSGGQRQRVAFARALAPNPQLLLLDEPFAAIDAKIRQELRTWLKDMIEKLGGINALKPIFAKVRLIRQKTPIGARLMIIMVISIIMSLNWLKKFATVSARSPIFARITPTIRANTIT